MLMDEAWTRERRMRARLLTTTDQFERMLLRRGYRWTVEGSQQPDIMYRIQRAGETSSTWIINAASLLYQSLLDVEALIDGAFAGGQHHQQCRTCQTPLLRAVEGRTTQFYVYRSLDGRSQPNGPDSPPITACPRCGAYLGMEQVIEIEDALEDEQEEG